MTNIDSLKRRKAQLEVRIKRMQARKNMLARKKRTRDLIELGGLVELANLRDFDRGALLGALLYIQALAKSDNEKSRVWKINGDTLLTARKDEREKRKKR